MIHQRVFFKIYSNRARGSSDTHISLAFRTLVAHQYHHCVTSASAFCHSAVANGLYTAAACLRSTLYSPDKVQRLIQYRGLRESEKERGVRHCHLKHSTITPFQTQRFRLTHLALSPPGKCIRGGWNVRARDEGRTATRSRLTTPPSDTGAKEGRWVR